MGLGLGNRGDHAVDLEAELEASPPKQLADAPGDLACSDPLTQCLLPQKLRAKVDIDTYENKPVPRPKDSQ
jgi:hypothetical protein